VIKTFILLSCHLKKRFLVPNSVFLEKKHFGRLKFGKEQLPHALAPQRQWHTVMLQQE